MANFQGINDFVGTYRGSYDGRNAQVIIVAGADGTVSFNSLFTVTFTDLDRNETYKGIATIPEAVITHIFSDFQLDADEIVDAAIEILRDQGLDAMSMRSVATRLGVSPVPLYSRIGNKEALVNAVAERMLRDLAPPATADEPWPTYAARWARELRSRLGQAPDARIP